MTVQLSNRGRNLRSTTAKLLPHNSCICREGFTLIELLVTIAVITILAAILLPALSKAKEAARRVSCQNNMKQLGTCLIIYDDDYGYLPGTGASARSQWLLVPSLSARIRMVCRTIAPAMTRTPAEGGDQTASWAYGILPYLGQMTLYENHSDSSVAETNIPLFQCPSEGTFGGLDYRACVGNIELLTGLPGSIAEVDEGAFRINWKPDGGSCPVKQGDGHGNSLEAIQQIDGDSNTILLAERLRGPRQQGSFLSGLYSTHQNGEPFDITVFTSKEGYGPEDGVVPSNASLSAGPSTPGAVMSCLRMGAVGSSTTQLKPTSGRR